MMAVKLAQGWVIMSHKIDDGTKLAHGWVIMSHKIDDGT